ncbi:MAG: protein TolQ [Alphaproteobacteria bacterium]|nr:protein TolQ [Alphaproteobacteria bacterium]MCB9792598.1 protein TolQ [Alphaproteobacteria bacterium]
MNLDSVITVLLVSAPESGAEISVVDLLLEADFVVQLVLLALLGMSIACWVIIFSKAQAIRKATAESAEFLEMFWSSRRLDQVYEKANEFPNSPIAEVFKSGYVELHKLTSAGDKQGGGGAMSVDMGASENLSRSLRRASIVELTNLERAIPFLATTGSTAPFIGLFGTVWGILRAFQRIGATGSASIQTVGPDIAHALIATAVGLAAAIPAVMAYNYFNSRLRVLNNEMENFSSDFLNIVKRHFRTR